MEETEVKTEDQKSTEESNSAESTPKKKFKIDKKMILSFVAGVVLTALVFTGVILGVNPDLLKDKLHKYPAQIELNFSFGSDGSKRHVPGYAPMRTD